MKVIRKQNITQEYNKNKVYDIRVNNNHNYYITKSNILVHNSGKSYVIQKIKSGQVDPRIVNTDTWTEYYQEKFGQADIDWKEYSGKIKQLTKDQLTNYLNSLLPLWIDGTSSNPSALMRRKGILQSIGYDVSMIFVDTPIETAIERNKQRGRTVDRDFLEKAYNHAQKSKDYYASEFGKNFTEILNGEGELNDKIIKEAYKKMDKFFLSNIKNPIGQQLIDEMKENGYKYLIDSSEYDMKYLSKLVSNWYKK